MKDVPTNPVGQGYALVSKLSSVLLWCSSQDYVNTHRTALIGLLNKLFNVTCYLSDIIDPDRTKRSQLDRIYAARLASNTKESIDVPDIG